MRHHEETIAAFVRWQREQADALGVVVVGSVARGDERSDSDVDVYVVVSDEAYAMAERTGAVASVRREGVTYPGGYVDIKLTSPGYLRRAAEVGDDLVRASLLGARVAWDSGVGLAELVAATVQPDDAVWVKRVLTYRAQVELYAGYFLTQGAALDDLFLTRHAAVHACLAAGRLALARHHRLFRGQKYLAKDLAALPLPEGFLDTWRSLLHDPDAGTGERLRQVVDDWFGDRLDEDASLSRFIADTEMGWLTGVRPPEFW